MKKMWEGACTCVKPVLKVCFIMLYWINTQATASTLGSFHEALRQMLPATLLCLSCRTCPSASAAVPSTNIIVPISPSLWLWLWVEQNSVCSRGKYFLVERVNVSLNQNVLVGQRTWCWWCSMLSWAWKKKAYSQRSNQEVFLLCYFTCQDLLVFTSLNTFAVPIQAQHLTKAICQVNIVGENLLGRCAFLSFLTMTDRTWCRDSNRAKETIKKIKKHQLPP